MTTDQQFISQIVTLGCASLVAIVAVIVAGAVARCRGPWWAIMGGLIVCGITIGVASQMFVSARYGGWSL